MSRYDDTFKDELYDSLEYAYTESRMTSLEFLKLVMGMLAELIGFMEWNDNHKKD